MPRPSEQPPNAPYASRAALKLAHALDAFGCDPRNLVCADLGCNAGGFTDVLLRRGAVRVYAIDTGYGMLDYRLRTDPRVIVMERTNALHATLPEAPTLITCDVAWTRQRLILGAGKRILHPQGRLITLVKPHYESESTRLKQGVVPSDDLPHILARVEQEMDACGFVVRGRTRSPLTGSKGGNHEALYLLEPRV